MARAALIWDPALAAYDLGDSHPLNPLRLTLSVELMDAFGILTEDALISPRPATEDELLLLLTHGILHLLGFDHEEPDQEREMFELQRTLLLTFLAGRGRRAGR